MAKPVLIHAGSKGLASVVIPMSKAFGARAVSSELSDSIAASTGHIHTDVIINNTGFSGE